MTLMPPPDFAGPRFAIDPRAPASNLSPNDPPAEHDPRDEHDPRAPRKRALAALLLLLISGATAGLLVLLGTLATPCSAPCLDDQPCAAHCTSTPRPALAQAPPAPDLPPSAATPAPVPTPPVPTPPPNTTPSAPAPAAAPVIPPVIPPTPAPSAPDRCDEPAFRATASAIVKDCERACKADASPLVGLSSSAIEALFGRPDDAGVATHFAFFGCSTWTSSGARQVCRGFDSAVADPAQCPSPAPPGSTCRADATALNDELTRFLDAHAEAHTILLFGTASRTGNAVSRSGERMSPENARLAEERARAVAEQVHAWRRKHQRRDLRVLSVALDNTRTDTWQSEAFRDIVVAQAKKSGSGRSFDPAAADAANRAVMVIALKCPALR